MRNENLIFVDIETTGTNPDKHEIIELAYILVKQDGGKFTVIEEREFKIKPEHIENAEPVALRINGYDPSQWIFASSLSEVMKVFSDKSSGAVFVAQNVTFDYSFIERAMTKCNVPNEMFYAKLDTISMAYAKLYKDPRAEKFSLYRLAEYFGITNVKSHTAMADTRTTFEVFKRLMSL